MRTLFRFTLVVCAFGALVSCGSERPASAEPVVVEVTAIHNAETNQHLFLTDVEEVPAGWTTFRLVNASHAAHFLLLELMPGGRTVEDSLAELVPVFQDAMDLINEGRAEDGFAKLGELPDWFSEIRFMGGPGLVAPERVAETTVFLEPGNYVMECYIKTDEGVFHSALGMIRGLRVTEERSPAAEPSNPSLRMTLTNEGFGVEGRITPGKHTVAVRFAEENPPLLGNDVHVARLEAEADLGAVAAWMDWSQPRGLVSDHGAPAPAEFVGGTHEMPQGYTAYFTVDLEPGRYAWISERPVGDPLYEEFTVGGP
jgi:hypothetical protein